MGSNKCGLNGSPGPMNTRTYDCVGSEGHGRKWKAKNTKLPLNNICFGGARSLNSQIKPICFGFWRYEPLDPGRAPPLRSVHNRIFFKRRRIPYHSIAIVCCFALCFIHTFLSSSIFCFSLCLFFSNLVSVSLILLLIICLIYVSFPYFPNLLKLLFEFWYLRFVW